MGLEEVEELYRLYAEDVYKFLLVLTRSPFIAEDVLQSTFLIAIRSLHTFKGNSSVKTWLIGIAKNEYYSYLRKNKEHLPYENLEQSINIDMTDHVIQQEKLTKVMMEVNKLPEIQRQIVILRLVNDLSFAQIAKIIGKSENYARVTYFRTKSKLRGGVEDE